MKRIELKPWTSIGWEEDDAAHRVVRKGLLSGFLGGELEGGPEVQGLEREWAATFGAKHAVSVNSATSGLLIALKAVGVGPGDEVIVSPFSMSAGVACVLWLGATPVFADINDDDYCLDVSTVTIRPKAVLTTSLFGKVSHLPRWPDGCPVIEDAAQAAFAEGVSQHSLITVFSLNCHKQIQSGEGGICTTNNDDVAMIMKKLRNHAELFKC